MHETSMQTCRLCDNNNAKMYSIFDKDSKGQQIMHIIQQCLSLIIFRTDPLSKQICETCLNQLEAFIKFKETSLNIANKQISNLSNSPEGETQSVQLYLACKESNENDLITSSDIPNRNSVGTSTNGLKYSCPRCKSNSEASSGPRKEVELCTELQKALSSSLTINKISSDADKGTRARRRRSQAFYHEVDDSLCSSMTEFTNTESSQCYEEYQSEMDSYDSDNEDAAHLAKRRKLDLSESIKKEKESWETSQQRTAFKNLFKEEEELSYNPLSLMNITINAINKQNLPEYESSSFSVNSVQPKCTYCNQQFKNLKLLALHEVEHISIELGEKVDNPTLWHESRDDAEVRNKWLNSYEEPVVECDEDGMDGTDCDFSDSSPDDNLLIPIGSELPDEQKPLGDMELIQGALVINGIPLSNYSKEERKIFCKPMRMGGINKRLCLLCRYLFKDNWAIDSHFSSLACYYTCRYCGHRFNKARHRFEEHVKEHEALGHPLSTKVFAASKLSNIVPKVVRPEGARRPEPEEGPEPAQPQPQVAAEPPKKRAYRRRTASLTQVKQEKVEECKPSKRQMMQKGSNNQAYFCRKCYKVFFKLDEFNIHSRNCDYNQFPSGRSKFSPAGGPNGARRGSPTPPAQARTPAAGRNGETVAYSASGRPIRQAVRDSAPYRDGSESPTPKQDAAGPQQQQQGVLCLICHTSFPTVYSRNSHMRIHKGETHARSKPGPKKQSPQAAAIPTFSSYIKQEPLEPEVHIIEADTEPKHESSNSIGSVSITPISKNPNQKPTINPNIMKLVQSNPHLTIKGAKSPEREVPRSASSGSRASTPPSSNTSMETSSSSASGGRKSYNCSSCGQNCKNKSLLYFHKKSQCTGSRYPCPFCKKRFGTETAYSSHIFYSHPE